MAGNDTPYKVSESAEKALAKGPSGNVYRGHYVVGLATLFGTTELSFFDAWAELHPSRAEPTHLLVWTPCSRHIFENHSVEFFYKGA